MNKERKETEYTIVLLITILFVGLMLFLYYSNYDFIVTLNLNIPILDNIFSIGTFSVFDRGFYTRGIFLFLSLIALFYSKRESEHSKI